MTTRDHPITVLDNALAQSTPLQWIRETCAEQSLNWWVFGGAIRDAILYGRTSADVDLYIKADGDVVEGIKKTLKEKFGQDCPVDLVACSDPVESIYQNDFTINCMLYDPAKQAILDPYGGVKSLQSKTLDVTSPMFFLSNPVSFIRGFRLAAQLGFTLGDDTLGLIQTGRSLLTGADPYRIARSFLEWLRFMSYPGYTAQLDCFEQAHLIEALFPQQAFYQQAQHTPQQVALAHQLEHHLQDTASAITAPLFCLQTLTSKVLDPNGCLVTRLAPVSFLRAAVWLKGFSDAALTLCKDVGPACYQHPQFKHHVEQVAWQAYAERFHFIEVNARLLGTILDLTRQLDTVPLPEVIRGWSAKVTAPSDKSLSAATP